LLYNVDSRIFLYLKCHASGGAESRETQLGAPERRVARLDHGGGLREQGQAQARARRGRSQETSHSGEFTFFSWVQKKNLQIAPISVWLVDTV